MRNSGGSSFLDLAVERGLLSSADAEQTLRTAQTRGDFPERVLVETAGVDKAALMRLRAESLRVPYVELGTARIDADAAALVSGSIARRHRLIPIGTSESIIRIAMADPTDIVALDEVRLRTGLAPDPVLSYVSDIERALDRIYADGDAHWKSIVQETAEEEAPLASPNAAVPQPDIDAPMVRLADLIIAQAVAHGASDIHIEPFESEIIVRYRLDGVLHQAMNPPRHLHAALVSRFKIMANLDIAERRVPQDGRIRLDHKNGEYDIRMSVLPTLWGESVVMRILDQKNVRVELDQLGFDAPTLGAWKKMIDLHSGVILVTGPTGSGKSTTLYATLNALNRSERKIVTIEDPVEYSIKGVNQVNVNPKVGLTFAAGLRAFLRQDPDIMMVGEIRDHETAVIAVQSAMTGHLVLATLHTNDAVSAMTRLIDMGVEPFLLASSVQGVLAQRLVRVVCERCRRRVQPIKPVETVFGDNGVDPESLNLMKGEGCDACSMTGYRGRAGIFELMVVSDELRHKVMERSPSHELQELALRHGMQRLFRDGLAKVARGETTLEEVMRVASD